MSFTLLQLRLLSPLEMQTFILIDASIQYFQFPPQLHHDDNTLHTAGPHLTAPLTDHSPARRHHGEPHRERSHAADPVSY